MYCLSDCAGFGVYALWHVDGNNFVIDTGRVTLTVVNPGGVDFVAMAGAVFF